MNILGPLKPVSSEIKQYWLPLYQGELACGLFGISEDFVENYLSLDEKFLRNREATFLVRAGGDSMSPEIKDNDILIVDRSLTAKHQSIIAVFYNGVAMCKQLYLEGENKYLRSFNSKYKNILIGEEDELLVFGVVIGLARDFY